jgi:PhzF family phenazine biosynthesis protein
MAHHDAGGHVLCIHSVVTPNAYQRMGIATWMLTEYLTVTLRAHPEITRVALLAKAQNAALYERCGFTSHGPSPVQHGTDVWYDLQMHCKPEQRLLQQFTVDAFASAPFQGNPAAVVVLPHTCTLPASVNASDTGTAVKQKLAMENNLSETAFVQRDAAAPWRWLLRWFTPSTEVTLCGHATLASAAAMWGNSVVPRSQDRIHFFTASGEVSVARQGEQFTLDFPAETHTACSEEQSADWVQHVRDATGQSDFTAIGCHTGSMDVIMHVSPEVFSALPPACAVDFSAIARVPKRGVILTSAGTGSTHFQSRFWGPNAGVNEDPVTGSAHCLLAPFWADLLQLADSGEEMLAYQSSSRGGWLRLRLDSWAGRVLISGAAEQTQISRLSSSVCALLLE